MKFVIILAGFMWLIVESVASVLRSRRFAPDELPA
jgi:hypothetical protein